MGDDKTPKARALNRAIYCGVGWFGLGFYGFWGMLLGWGPAILCVAFLIAGWALLAAAIVFVILGVGPTQADLDEKHRVEAQESFIREQQYEQYKRQSETGA